MIAANNLLRYQESFDIGNIILRMDGLPEDERKKIEKIRDSNIDHIIDDNIIYPAKKICQIKEKDNTRKYLIFTITTCKRYDLFHKTINSFSSVFSMP